MNAKWMVAIALLAATACKQDPPAETTTETAKQTAEKPLEAKPASLGAEYAAMDADAQQKVITSGDPAKVRDLMFFNMFKVGNRLRDGQVGPFEVAGKKIDKPLMLGLRQTRHIAMNLVQSPADCQAACQRAEINKLIEPLTQSLFYRADGSIDAEVAKTLIEKLWVDPTDKILGVPASDIYSVFRPSIREYALVYKALDAYGVDTIKSEYNAALAEAPDKMPTFYRRFVNLNDIASKAGLDKSMRLAIASGFWMRRYADTTAPLVQETLKRILSAYDKPLHDEVFAAQ